MENRSVASGFDYYIYESSGIVGVKNDGTKHPISQEEWKRIRPEHRSTGCGECTFVLDQQTLFTFFVSNELKNGAKEKPVFVGNFTMPGWTGHSGFYLFKCAECQSVCADYPHGYTSSGSCYLRCTECSAQLVIRVNSFWGKNIYQREKIVPPPTFMQIFRSIWELRKRGPFQWFQGTDEELRLLKKPLNIEDQQKLKTPGRIPGELES